jgi:hypothetical protein
MSEYLFPNFLQDPREYELAQEFWRNKWQETLERTGKKDLWITPWFGTTFTNGTPCLDGNPIFSAVCPSRRLGIFVIQLEPSANPSEVEVWTDTFAHRQPEEVKELVISCVLTEETQCIALDLMHQWITSEQVAVPRVPKLLPRS